MKNDGENIFLERWYGLYGLSDIELAKQAREILGDQIVEHARAWIWDSEFAEQIISKLHPKHDLFLLEIITALNGYYSNYLNDIREWISIADQISNDPKGNFADHKKKLANLSAVKLLRSSAIRSGRDNPTDRFSQVFSQVIVDNLKTPSDKFRLACRQFISAFDEINKTPPNKLERPIIDSDKSLQYLKTSAARFENLTLILLYLSQKFRGSKIKTKYSGWASVLFTRLVVLMTSLDALTPYSKRYGGTPTWDASSVAMIVRGIAETCMLYYYLCVDRVSDEEWDARIRIVQLHDCVSRIDLFSSDISKNDSELKSLEESRNFLQGKLSKNSFFQTISEKRQRRILKGYDMMLLNQDEIHERMGDDPKAFRWWYRLLSAHVHSFPLSFYRSGDKLRGGGSENMVDAGYISFHLEAITPYIARTFLEYSSLQLNSQLEKFGAGI